MFPLYDENRFKGRPLVTWALIAVNVLVFVWELDYTGLFVNEDAILKILQNYGATPARFAGAIDFDTLFTLISSMFLHGGFLHIIGNMVFLYIFGDNIEAKFGHAKFLLLYVIFGLAGAFLQIFFAFLPGGDPSIPAIGASAAISGVLGAYVVFFPFNRVVTVVFYFFFIRLVKIPAIVYLGLWFLLQFLSGAVGASGDVGYWAHVGGFVAGFLVAGFARVTGLSREQI